MFRLMPVLMLALAVHVVAAPDPLAGDYRLNEPISLSHTFVSMEDLAKEVGKELKVSVAASVATRDLKAAVFTRELPARQVLTGLAKAMDLTWERTGKSPEWKYTLIQTLAQRRRLESLEQYINKKIRGSASDYLSDCTKKLDKGLVSDAKRAGELDSEIENLCKARAPGWEEKVKALCTERGKLEQCDLDQYLTGYVVRQLTPQMWNDLMNGGTFTATMNAQPPGLSLPPDAVDLKRLDDASSRAHVISSHLGSGNTDSSAFGFGGPDPETVRQAVFSLHIDPDRGLVTGLKHENWNSERWGGEASSEVCGYSAKELEKAGMDPDFVAAAPNRAAIGVDKALDVKFAEPAAKSQPRAWVFGDTLKRAFERSTFSFVADAGRRKDRAGWSPSEPEKVSQFVEACVDNYVVSRDGDLIALRNRRAFYDRPREIPERVLRPFETNAQEQGGVGLEEAASLVIGLTELQVRSLERYEVWMADETNVSGWNDGIRRIRLWGSLNQAQHRQAEEGGGLPFVSLSPAEQQLFQQALVDRPLEPEMLFILGRTETEEYSVFRGQQQVSTFKDLSAAKQAFSHLGGETKPRLERSREQHCEFTFTPPRTEGPGESQGAQVSRGVVYSAWFHWTTILDGDKGK